MTKERTKELKHNRTLLHKDSSQEEKNSHKRRPRRPPLFAGAVGGHRSDILNATNLQARTGKCTQSRLSSWSRTFCLVATSRAHLDMQGSESKFLRQEKNLANQAPRQHEQDQSRKCKRLSGLL